MYKNSYNSEPDKFGLLIQLYADDSQLYLELKQNCDTCELKINIESCLNEIKVWMSTNFMKLNESKTELILFNPPRHPYNVAFSDSSFNIEFDGCILEDVTSVKSLGVTLSSELQLKTFITKKCQACNLQLHNLKHIKNSLNVSMRTMLITNLILTKLDFCNSLLAACPVSDLYHLQRTE